MKKILVLYYSFEGATKKVAEAIAEEIKADTLEIKPVDELKSKGFSKFLWGGSQVFMGKKPELLPLEKKIDDYDLILVGTPIWAGTFTPPIRTILEGDYIKNKEVILFYTHEGGPGKVEIKAKAIIEKNNNFIEVKGFLNPLKGKEEVYKSIKEWASSIKSS